MKTYQNFDCSHFCSILLIQLVIQIHYYFIRPRTIHRYCVLRPFFSKFHLIIHWKNRHNSIQIINHWYTCSSQVCFLPCYLNLFVLLCFLVLIWLCWLSQVIIRIYSSCHFWGSFVIFVLLLIIFFAIFCLI